MSIPMGAAVSTAAAEETELDAGEGDGAAEGVAETDRVQADAEPDADTCAEDAPGAVAVAPNRDAADAPEAGHSETIEAGAGAASADAEGLAEPAEDPVEEVDAPAEPISAEPLADIAAVEDDASNADAVEEPADARAAPQTEVPQTIEDDASEPAEGPAEEAGAPAEPISAEPLAAEPLADIAAAEDDASEPAAAVDSVDVPAAPETEAADETVSQNQAVPPADAAHEPASDWDAAEELELPRRPPEPPPPPIPDGPAGEILAEARTARGLSLEDASDATRVRREYLAAIEAMDPRRLPMGPYAAGFVGAYARFLDLDPAAVTARFNEEMSPRRKLKLEAPGMAAPVGAQPWLTRRRAMMAAAAAVMALVVWVGLQPGDEADIHAVPPVPEALEAWVRAEPGADGARLLAEFEAAEGAAIRLTAREPVRVDIYGGGGEIVFARYLRANESYDAPQRAGLLVAARNAGAVEVFRDGESMGRMGRAGAPVRNWSVDEARRAAPVEDQPLIEIEPAPAPAAVEDPDAAASDAPSAPVVAAAPAPPRPVEDDYLPVSRILTETLPPLSGEVEGTGTFTGFPRATSVEELPPVRATAIEPLPPAEGAPD